ncbi:hypothetical protein Pres01_29780 [Metapseudomonas resinovorans]|nr:hypothetical protein Pres01_29780 [Pseudomonas resinovorans]
MIAQYRDARTQGARQSQIATLSHIFNMEREWGLTTKEPPLARDRETPRDYYANDAMWNAVYGGARTEGRNRPGLPDRPAPSGRVEHAKGYWGTRKRS